MEIVKQLKQVIYFSLFFYLNEKKKKINERNFILNQNNEIIEKTKIQTIFFLLELFRFFSFGKRIKTIFSLENIISSK